MSSVNIPLNLDSRQNATQTQHYNQRVVKDFYAYQDAHSGMMPETKIAQEQEAQELCFKKTLLMLIIALSSVTLIKSAAINSYKLSKNLALNFHLNNHQKKLKAYKTEIKAKIKANKSYRGMKKIIRQEIKALDANEILIRFEK